MTQDERKLLILLADCVLQLVHDRNWPFDEEERRDNIGKLVELADTLEAEMPEPNA